jgi:deoxyribodipyrimidine photo-lyase
MIAFRRAHWNFSLQRAVDWARELKRPLLILEALSCDFPWANERLCCFILEGMKDNWTDFKNLPVFYFPFLEGSKGQGKGLMRALGARSCLVVTDDYPCFFLPRMIGSVGESLTVRMEAVDSNGLFPVALAQRVFLTAHSFRRYLQLQLPQFLDRFPKENPLWGVTLPVLGRLPQEIEKKWPAADMSSAGRDLLRSLPLDHGVEPVKAQGGHKAAKNRLADFIHSKLNRYHLDGKHPDAKATSGLSAYIHFGHISVCEIFTELTKMQKWSPASISQRASGKKEGWWAMGPGAEAFLDQLLTWRELGFNFCANRADYDRFESLPQWALQTLAAHEGDYRPYVYSLEEFEAAKTHDPLWNAAQNQLLAEGQIHNRLRMLWGKKIVEWSRSATEALAIMIELNNKYALDGRDPNSYSGIFWVLGRYDRPFGPKRPILGTVRYMSSQNTKRKLKLTGYMRSFAQKPGG